MPSRTLYPKDEFELVVRSRFKRLVKTIEVQITVAAPLEIIFDDAYPKAALNSEGKSVFKQVKFDGSATKVYAVLAGRVQGPSGDEDEADAPTEELLFTLKIRVAATLGGAKSAAVQVTKLDGVTDTKENTITPSATSVVRTRDGWVEGSAALTYFSADDLVMIYGAAVNGSSEIVNTAALTGIPTIATAVVAEGLKRSGEFVAIPCSVRGSYPALQTSGPSAAEAAVGICGSVFLSGAEVTGSPRVDVIVETSPTMGITSVPFRVHGLASATLAVGYPAAGTAGSPPPPPPPRVVVVRPVSGWINHDADADCKLLRYPPMPLSVTASFSDSKVQDFADVPIGGIALLATSSDLAVATINVRTTVSGVEITEVVAAAAGTCQIQLRSASGDLLDTVAVEVKSPEPANQLLVVGIDATVIKGFESVVVGDENVDANTATFARNARLTAVAKPSPVKLEYDGDAVSVVAFAVFDDGSRFELGKKDGLRLQTLDSMALRYDATLNRLVVPFDPKENKPGPLVRATWRIDPVADVPCGVGGMISKAAFVDIDLQVKPPKAQALRAKVSATLLACKDDYAAMPGVGLPTTATLTVALLFPQNVVQDNLEGDKRVAYTILDGPDSTAPASFTIDSKGLITANCIAGRGMIRVSFRGQEATAQIAIEVVTFDGLVVGARPWPPFNQSLAVEVKQLSLIECTTPAIYQQAQLYARMRYSNGAITNDIPTIVALNRVLSFQNVDQDSISVNENNVFVPNASVAGGLAKFTAYFGIAPSGVSSTVQPNKTNPTLVAIAVTDAPVSIVSAHHVSFVPDVGGGTDAATGESDNAGTESAVKSWDATLHGKVGVAGSRIKLGVTMSDGRAYDSVIAPDGTLMLPGAIGYSSVPGSVGLDVDANNGNATLKGNHHHPIDVLVTVCPSSSVVDGIEIARLAIACNVDPSEVGDGDLGLALGLPVPPVAVGSLFPLAMRVNTGNVKISSFNVVIKFDPEAVSFVKADLLISTQDGSTQFSVGISPDGTSVRVAGTIAGSKVSGSEKGTPLFELTFIATSAGTTEFTGSIDELWDTTPGAPKRIGSKNTTAHFDAGSITVSITQTRLARRLRANNSRHRTGGRGDSSGGGGGGGGNSDVGRTLLEGIRPEDTELHSRHARSLVRDPRNNILWDLDKGRYQRSRLHRRGLSGRSGEWDPGSMTNLHLERGDVNCDGVFDLRDPIFILEYVAARGNDFTTALGKTVNAAVGLCQAARNLTGSGTQFLDVDANTEINLLDVTYLLDIVVDKFFFFDVHVDVVNEPCKYNVTVSAVVVDRKGASPNLLRVLFDIAFPGAFSTIEAMLSSSNNLVSLNRKDGKVHGGLIELQRDEVQEGLFSVTFVVDGYVKFNDVGFSMVQIFGGALASGVRWKFFTGSPRNVEYKGLLEYNASDLNVESSLSRRGYSPLLGNLSRPTPDSVCTTTTTTTTSSTSTVSSTTTTTSTTSVTTTTTTNATLAAFSSANSCPPGQGGLIGTIFLVIGSFVSILLLPVVCRKLQSPQKRAPSEELSSDEADTEEDGDAGHVGDRFGDDPLVPRLQQPSAFAGLRSIGSLNVWLQFHLFWSIAVACANIISLFVWVGYSDTFFFHAGGTHAAVAAIGLQYLAPISVALVYCYHGLSIQEASAIWKAPGVRGRVTVTLLLPALAGGSLVAASITGAVRSGASAYKYCSKHSAGAKLAAPFAALGAAVLGFAFVFLVLPVAWSVALAFKLYLICPKIYSQIEWAFSKIVFEAPTARWDHLWRGGANRNAGGRRDKVRFMFYPELVLAPSQPSPDVHNERSAETSLASAGCAAPITPTTLQKQQICAYTAGDINNDHRNDESDSSEVLKEDEGDGPAVSTDVVLDLDALVSSGSEGARNKRRPESFSTQSSERPSNEVLVGNAAFLLTCSILMDTLFSGLVLIPALIVRFTSGVVPCPSEFAQGHVLVLAAALLCNIGCIAKMFRTRPSKIFNPAAFYLNPADRKKVANGVMEEAVEGEQGSGGDNDDDADSMKYVLLQEEVDDGNGEEVKVDNNEETVDNGVNNAEEDPPELTPPVTPEIQTPSRSGRLSLSDAMLALLPPPKPQPPPVVVVELMPEPEPEPPVVVVELMPEPEPPVVVVELMPEPEPEHSIMVMMPIPGDRPVMAPDGDRDTSRDSMIKLDVKKIETEKLSKWGKCQLCPFPPPPWVLLT